MTHRLDLRPLAAALLFGASFLPCSAVYAANSVVIWPINPVIMAQDKAAALWLENSGDTPMTLQVQSFAWSQQNGEDVYAAQQEVVATPALVTMPPKSKQLIRLTRLSPPPKEGERAYRLILDEVPRATLASSATANETSNTPDAASNQGAGVNFRMRYSLPLFSYAPHVEPDKLDRVSQLAWRVVQTPAGAQIEISNQAKVHARLTDAKLDSDGQQWQLAGGLLGYVLPGRSMIFPLPEDMSPAAAQRATLSLSVNGTAVPLLPKNQSE